MSFLREWAKANGIDPVIVELATAKSMTMLSSGELDAYVSMDNLSAYELTVAQFMRDNWAIVLGAIVVVFGVVVFLLAQRLRAQRLANDREREAEAERAERQRVEAEALRHELEQERQLKEARRTTFTDRLTGVKNRNAYLEAEQRMHARITDGTVGAFGVVVFDVNDLKHVNDTRGHEAGDQLIKDACRLVCVRFAHSPVYRVGGDEFVAVLEGADYDNREGLMADFDAQAEENARSGRVVVSCGCACFEPGQDSDMASVANRADEAMYARKRELKGLRG